LQLLILYRLILLINQSTSAITSNTIIIPIQLPALKISQANSQTENAVVITSNNMNNEFLFIVIQLIGHGHE